MTDVQKKLELRPITYREACDYVAKFHRHHTPLGCKYAVGAFIDDQMVGCAVCGRPVARLLDDGFTCEITRLCTDGTRNACSFLYGAACRVAKAMGYRKMITYTLESEIGSSLLASGFTCEGIAGAKNWMSSARAKNRKKPSATLRQPQEMKKRWVKMLI